jgi:hypothetical protein
MAATTLRYTFAYDGVWAHEEGWDTVEAVLERRCGLHWWYRDPVVEGEPFRRLIFSVTVTGRDRWFTHTRAMRLAEAIYMSLSLSAKLVPTPTWEVLPPHMNRGRNRVPRSGVVDGGNEDGSASEGQ